VNTKTAQLVIDNQTINFPTLTGTLGPDVVDVKNLVNYGHYTFDPGFYSTASCESKITFIDGDEGILLYRGYPIDQLADRSDYMEVCYLLMNGELPNQTQKEEFVTQIKRNSGVHEQITHFFNGFRRDAHPMAIMVGVVGALSAFYPDSLEVNEEEHRLTSAFRLIGKCRPSPR
jgi:citrate synthase